MSGHTKETAFRLYADHYYSGLDLPEETFEGIWSGIANYVAAVIHNAVSCCDFDFDDHYIEVQIACWQAFRDRRIPPDDVGLFTGSIVAITRRTLIDRYRKTESLKRSEARYIEETGRRSVEPIEKVAGDELARRYPGMLAGEMAARARLPVLTEEFCREAVPVLLSTESRRGLMELVKGIDFWDKEFLVTYVLLLFRWAQVDLNEELY